MSFLQPILLVGLPLALLPIVIHLINQHRHRTVRWAAMMFLLDAKKMTRGMARLRQILILAMRVLAVIMLIVAAGRPLAGGWLALTGGKADTVLILLDRSASMEQQNLETGESKRSEALRKISDLLAKTSRGSEVVLIDSATLAPTPVLDLDALAELPESGGTHTAADIPSLFEKAIDWLATDESGRTDIWLASDLRQADWNSASGQWANIRSALAARETVRLFLLTFPGTDSENLSVSVEQVRRRRTPEGHELVMDLAIRRPGSGEDAEDLAVPVEFTINGTRTVEELTISGAEMVRLGHVLPLGSGNAKGWGRIDLPADENPADNSAYFVFDEPAPRRTVIVSDDAVSAEAIRAAATSAVDPSVKYEAITLTPDQSAQVPWNDTALLFWHAPLPAEGSPMAALLRQHVEEGRTLVLLPPETPGENSWFGLRWGELLDQRDAPLEIGWWRTESGLLANTRSGAPLPIGELRLFRTRSFTGELQPILKLESGEPVIAQAITGTGGSLYVMGTLPRSDFSTLATDGVAFFVLIHRALDEGTNAVSRAQARVASTDAFDSRENHETLDASSDDDLLVVPRLRAGAFSVTPAGGGPFLVALNRPREEDGVATVDEAALAALLEGVEFRAIADEVDSGSSLASEVWRTFLVVMALALLVEAALCLPPVPEPREATPDPGTRHSP